MTPEYIKAAERLPNFTLAKIDVTAYSKAKTLYLVHSYPTLYYFKGEDPVSYNGAKNAEAIVSYVIKK